MVDWTRERAGLGPCAGIDEAGRGPAAGPVVAAAVILDPAGAPEGLDDSKRLSAARRERLFVALATDPATHIGVGIAEPEEIDRLNLLAATLNAMARAVAALPVVPMRALVDGDAAPSLPCAVETVVGGDGVSVSIAAASIVAKVTRDQLMQAAHARWPAYGFDRHVGYLTARHREALARLGPAPIHRRRFAPVRQALSARAADNVALAR